MKKILDLGCADRKLAERKNFKGYSFDGEIIGLDYTKTKTADVVCDLNKGKLPFKENTFDIVYTSHCLEHISNILPIILEVHRVLKKGGYFLIIVPHVSSSSSMTNLTHVRTFGYNSMDCFTSEEDDNNTQMDKLKGMFKIIKRKIKFGRMYRNLGIEFLANKSPIFYTEFLSWIFPAREMIWELRKE